MQALEVSSEVQQGLADNRPVVALESAVYAAFPGSVGLDLVHSSEEAVRQQGAVPATIGIADGKILVGFTDTDAKQFAEVGSQARKVGARDIAPCLVSGGFGVTTIGATLALARVSGIRFAAASGLGGVHRGYAVRPDVSADLGELAGAPVLLVTGGVKSFLDVTATAEVLETLSIPVLGFKTNTLPLYFATAGGPPASARVEAATDAAQIAWHHWNTLGRNSGILLGQPPRIELSDVQDVIAKSLQCAEADGIEGPAVTAYVLGEVHRRTGGRTKDATKQLILDTAELAGEIASAYFELEVHA
ncbi:pseudouridine-5'-phosphate glycosidase [Actinomycetes bacterium M1A6_2h]